MGFECRGAQRDGARGRGGYLVAMGFERGLGYVERVGGLDLAQLEGLVRRTKYCICRLRVGRARSGGLDLGFDGEPSAYDEKGVRMETTGQRTYSGGLGASISSTISGGSSSRRKCCCWWAMEKGTPPSSCCVAMS